MTTMDHRNTALPIGWPENRSSNRPKGAPTHRGHRPGRIWRQAISIIRPSGGSSGRLDRIGKAVIIEAISTDATGTSIAINGDWRR